MLSFVIRRLAISIPVIIASSFIVFILVATAGGDPLADLRLRPGVSEATIKLREHQLGLDKPVMTRYWEWVKGASHGDFGRSVSNEEVSSLLRRRLGVTMRLVIGATILGAIIAVVIGALQAVKQYSKFDYSMTFLAFLFFSMPVFWLAAILRDVGIRINKAAGHRLLFVVGQESPDLHGGFVSQWLDRVGHLILPTITLVVISVAGWSRFQRGSMLEVMNADFVRTAKAKGLRPSGVIFRHALRNAMIPVVTIVAIDFATILGGAIITETVFGWTGMGRLLLDSLKVQDVNVVQAWLLITAILVVVFNLIADIIYGYLDPRISRG